MIWPAPGAPVVMEADLAGRKFEAGDLLRALDDITDMLEKGAKALWGTDDFSKISEAGLSYEYEQFRRHYMPSDLPRADRS